MPVLASSHCARTPLAPSHRTEKKGFEIDLFFSSLTAIYQVLDDRSIMKSTVLICIYYINTKNLMSFFFRQWLILFFLMATFQMLNTLHWRSRQKCRNLYLLASARVPKWGGPFPLIIAVVRVAYSDTQPSWKKAAEWHLPAVYLLITVYYMDLMISTPTH